MILPLRTSIHKFFPNVRFTIKRWFQLKISSNSLGTLIEICESKYPKEYVSKIFMYLELEHVAHRFGRIMRPFYQVEHDIPDRVPLTREDFVPLSIEADISSSSLCSLHNFPSSWSFDPSTCENLRETSDISLRGILRSSVSMSNNIRKQIAEMIVRSDLEFYFLNPSSIILRTTSSDNKNPIILPVTDNKKVILDPIDGFELDTKKCIEQCYNDIALNSIEVLLNSEFNSRNTLLNECNLIFAYQLGSVDSLIELFTKRNWKSDECLRKIRDQIIDILFERRIDGEREEDIADLKELFVSHRDIFVSILPASYSHDYEKFVLPLLSFKQAVKYMMKTHSLMIL